MAGQESTLAFLYTCGSEIIKRKSHGADDSNAEIRIISDMAWAKMIPLLPPPVLEAEDNDHGGVICHVVVSSAANVSEAEVERAMRQDILSWVATNLGFGPGKYQNNPVLCAVHNAIYSHVDVEIYKADME